jgi:hypothetical protein
MPTTRTITPEMQRQLDEVIRLCLDSVTIAEKCCAAPLHGDAEQWTRFLNLCRDLSDTCTCTARLCCHNSEFLFQACALGAGVSEACAQECEKMAPHAGGEIALLLRKCAETVRKCGDASRRLSRLQGEGHAWTDLPKKETAKGGFASA